MTSNSTDVLVELTTTDHTFCVRTETYRLDVALDEPRAVLSAPDGTVWSDLSVIAGVDRTTVQDESFGVPTWTIARHRPLREDVELMMEVGSTAWDSRVVKIRCTTDAVRVSVKVHGRGRLGDVTLLGGRAAMPSGACGTFRSQTGFRSVFVPTPTEPVQVVRAASASAQLGVVGDAEPGRLNGIFSPPPYCLAFGRHASVDATSVPSGPWLGAGVVGPIAALTFTTVRYDVLDGGWLLRLAYEGHTVVNGVWSSPEIVLRPTASPWQSLTDYRADLVGQGWAPAAPDSARVAPPWWSEPIFCGWGAQCAHAESRRGTGPVPGDSAAGLVGGIASVSAPDFARRDLYDRWLARLEAHDVHPGTVVIDDRWQAEYGVNTVDAEKWPDLRGWIADRHAAGQRVLLWLKAWDHRGLPDSLCITDRSGAPLAVDPSNPEYLRVLSKQVALLLSPEGFDADGFKVDFTQRTPSGAQLRSWGDRHGGGVWGTAALHALLGAIYEAAKVAKPDALVITHAPHPSFGDVSDMIRLNDVLERDPEGAAVPVAAQVRFRAAVTTAVLPGHLIDTDQWPMPDHAQWREYVDVQGGLGVPALYYVEAIERTGEEVTSEDLRAVAETWRVYRARASAG